MARLFLIVLLCCFTGFAGIIPPLYVGNTEPILDEFKHPLMGSGGELILTKYTSKYHKYLHNKLDNIIKKWRYYDKIYIKSIKFMVWDNIRVA